MFNWHFTRPKCPACGKPKTKEKTERLQLQLVEHMGDCKQLIHILYDSSLTRAYDSFVHRNAHWACDDCLNDGQAIAANFSKQLYCLAGPILAYYDQRKTCRTCRQPFTFSKEEQRYWYETRQFWVMSHAVDCKRCRFANRTRAARIKQAQAEIAALKADFDRSNPDQIRRLIELYTQTDSYKKVREYQQLLKKAQ